MHIFLDSNIFIHFEDFDTTNWFAEKYPSAHTVTICPYVIEELDKYKIGNSNKSKIVRRALTKIEEQFDDNDKSLANGLKCEIIAKKPTGSIFQQYELNPNEPDHKILACILDYALKKSLELTEIVFISNDVTPRILAKTFGLISEKPDSNYFRKLEKSENDKIIEKQNIKINSLLEKMPKIEFNFKSGKQFKRITYKQIEKSFEPIYLEKMKLVQDRYKVDDVESKNRYKGARLINLVEQSNTDSKLKYIKDYENWLNKVESFLRRKDLSFKINLKLTNNGTFPAEDVDLVLIFPSQIKLITEEELNKFPKEPEAPSRDIHSFPSIAKEFDFETNDFSKLINPSRITSVGNSNIYEESYVRVKHGHEISINHLCVQFPSYENIQNFKLKYIITVANMPNKLSGELNVILEKVTEHNRVDGPTSGN